jgi:hypothetical protein
MAVLPCEIGIVCHSHGNIVLAVFKMAVSIQNPAKCEVRAVIRFLHAKEETAAEIHRQLVSVYGEDVMNRQNGVVNLKREEVMFMMK